MGGKAVAKVVVMADKVVILIKVVLAQKVVLAPITGKVMTVEVW